MGTCLASTVSAPWFFKERVLKYLIASEGNSIEDNVSSHFGRAAYYIVYDDSRGSAESIVDGEQSDPIQLIKEAAESGARTLICGNIDQVFFTAAEQNEIQVGVSPHISALKAVELASKRQLAIAKSATIRRQSQHT